MRPGKTDLFKRRGTTWSTRATEQRVIERKRKLEAVVVEMLAWTVRIKTMAINVEYGEKAEMVDIEAMITMTKKKILAAFVYCSIRFYDEMRD